MNKNIKGIIIGLVIILLIGISVFFGYNYFKLKNESNTNNNSINNNENSPVNNINNNDGISSDIKKQVLSLIGLDESGFPRLDKETIKDLELTGNDYIDGGYYGIQAVFLSEVSSSTIINDFSKEGKLRLIFNYAMTNNLSATVSGDEYEWCSAGSGLCDAIDEDNYKLIAKKYGIKDDGDILFDGRKYKNYYLFFSSGSVLHPQKIQDSLSFSKDNDDIVVTYEIKLHSINDNDESETINNIYKYTFKINGNDYYLSKVDVNKK